MIRVASYNIRKSVGQDWRRNPARVLNVLNEIDADVVALQEVDRRFGRIRASSLSPEQIEAETDYKPIRFNVREHSLGWHGNALLVRRGFEVLDSQRIDLPSLEPRGAVTADIAADGRRLRVVAMHLGLLKRWRERQACAVLSHLETLEGGLPTVMMGDFNEWGAASGCFEHFSRHHQIVDPGPSFPTLKPVASLDRIVTSDHLDTVSAGVHLSELARAASDHLPVWAHLAFMRQGGKTP